MPTVSVELPSILRTVAGWQRIEVGGRTIGEALEAAFERTPALRHHLTLESGELRPHILCILNDATVPRAEALATLVQAGDEILIHQAISGG
jgi:molybdopterin converting factor small subunit